MKFILNSCVPLIVAVCLLTGSQPAYSQLLKNDTIEYLSNGNNDTTKVEFLISLSKNFLESDADTSVYFALQAKEMAGKINFLKGKAAALQQLRSVYFQTGDYRNCLSADKELLTLGKAMDDLRVIATAKAQLGVTYGVLHYELRAYQRLTRAIEHFKQLGDKKHVSEYSAAIGNIYASSNDFASARKYYALAIQWAEGDTLATNLLNIDFAELLQKEEKYDEALPYMEEALRFFIMRKNENEIARIQMLKGQYYLHTEQFQPAQDAFMQALTIYENDKTSDNHCRARTELGHTALKLKDYTKAIKYFNESIQVCEAPKNYDMLLRIYSGLVEGHRGLKNFQAALENERMIAVCKDSISAISQRVKLDELRLHYDTNLNEQEVARLKSEKTNNQTIIILLLLLMFLTGVIVFLAIRRQKSRIRSSESGRKALEMILKTKNEIENNLKAELEFKTKELTAFALSMIQKKEMLNTIKLDIEEIKSKVEDDSRSQLNRILATINFSQRLDKDWDNFKLYFEQVHHGFFDSLNAIYPGLNANDLRLCALIRLNLDTKQIASIMDIAPESAKVAKHRIRKKLGLTNNDNLHLFFSGLSAKNGHGFKNGHSFTRNGLSLDN